VSLDRSREAFVELVSNEEPVVAHLTADLDVDADPLAAYAALTGRTSDVRSGLRAATGDDDAEHATGNHDYSFLLESAEKVASSDPDGAFAPETDDRHARFSFVGYGPEAVVTVDGAETTVEAMDESVERLLTPDGGDVLDQLRAVMPDVERRGFPDVERQQLQGGLVGFLGYDAVYDLWLDEVGIDRPDSRFPDAQFVLSTRTVQFDHAAESVSLVFTPIVGPEEDAGERYDALAAEAERVERAIATADPLETGGVAVARETAGPQAEYEAAVERAKEHVLDGDIYQGVISRTRELYGDVDPLGLYDALRSVNPSPYMYLLDYDDLSVVGASPETLVSISGDRIVSNPIAGTCSRGTSPVEDRRLAGEMLADGKERAEHTMLVDLARNDVRRVGEPGSVRVEEFMNVLKYSHVQHIESTVTATMADDSDAFDAVRATFPAGTLSGAPKVRAMEIIDDLERSPRGLYGGGVGYFSWTGDADFAIVIRSATIENAVEPASAEGSTDALDRITVQAGAGIVADSVPVREYEETEKKMGGVLDALAEIRDDSGTEPVTEAMTEEVPR